MKVKVNKDPEHIRSWIRENFKVGDKFCLYDMKKALPDVEFYTMRSTLKQLKLRGKVRKLDRKHRYRRTIQAKDRTINKKVVTWEVMANV